MIYSERTYELDAPATVSALKDVIQRQLNAEQLQQHMDLIRQANGRLVEASSRQMLFPAGMLTVSAEFWSNAISWVAGKTEDAERKLEISKLAGQVLSPA